MKTLKKSLPLLAIVAVAAFLRFYQLDSVPPGLAHDEAMNGVDALEVIYNGYHPLYFERNQGGREPLFIYLTTAAVYIWRAVPFAMRLVPALIGLLTVALTYAFANKLFGRSTALVAAALLALSHWHLHFSRTSFRAISFPLLATLAFFLLWKAITSGRSRYFALGGLATGLAMYTYFSSRLLPILLAVFFAYLALLHRRKVSWRGVALFSAVAVLVSAPLAYYYLTHQYIFFARVNQVSALNVGPQSDLLASVWGNTYNTLVMFHYLGDIYWKHNLPGKPIFDGIGFVLFLVGLGLSLYGARRDAAKALLLFWLIVMLLPSALSIESPSFIRSLGAIPAIFILPALPVGALWSRLGAFMSRRTVPHLRWVLPLAVAIWLAFVGSSTFRGYFWEWGKATETYYAFDTPMTEIGRFLSTQRDDVPVLLSSRYYLHPSFLFLLQGNREVRWFNASQSLVFPDYDRQVTYAFPYTATSPRVTDLFPSRDMIASAPGPEGTTAFSVYRSNPFDLRQAALRAIPQSIDERGRGDLVDLLGYRAGSEVVAGETLPLDILWRVKQKPKAGAELAFFSHLVDQQWQMWGLGDANEYPAPEWAEGDMVIGSYDLTVRADTPPGRYFVDVGVYDRRTGEKMYFSGKDRENHILLGPVKVKRAQPFPVSAIRVPFPATFDRGIELLGYDAVDRSGQPTQSMKPGEPLKVTLYWQTSARQREDYSVFLHLLDAKNAMVAQDDSQPAASRFPTTFWDVGETVVDEHRLTIEPGLPPGEYALEAGMYLPKSGERLGILENGRVETDHLILGKVKVEAPQ